MADYPSKRKYDAANTVFIGLKLNKNTDADIIEYLEKSGNKQGAIKAVLRKAIGKGNKTKTAHDHAKQIHELYDQQSEIARSEGKQFEDYTVEELVLTAKNIIDIMGDWNDNDYIDQNYKRGQLTRLRNFVKKWGE